MNELRITKISFDGDDLIADFTGGKRLRIPLVRFPRVCAGTEAQRNDWSLVGKGRGVHWEALDEDLSVENLLAAYSRAKSVTYASPTA